MLFLKKCLSYLSDGTEHLFLMRVHLCKCPDLGQVDIFSITEGNNLVEGEDEVKAVLRNLTLLQDTTIFRNLPKYKKNEHISQLPFRTLIFTQPTMNMDKFLF